MKASSTFKSPPCVLNVAGSSASRCEIRTTSSFPPRSIDCKVARHPTMNQARQRRFKAAFHGHSTIGSAREEHLDNAGITSHRGGPGVGYLAYRPPAPAIRNAVSTMESREMLGALTLFSDVAICPTCPLPTCAGAYYC